MTYKLADGWKEVKLGEVALLNANNYSKSDDWKFVNYLNTGNITNNTIDHVKHINLTIDKLPSRARRKVSKDDIVYSTVRPVQKHLGIIRKPVKNMLVSTGFTVITVDKNIVDAYYLYLYLTQEPLTNHLQSIAEQRVSTYPALNVSDIENLLIWLPPLPEQKAIADTLSALDDKIELNNKINENLEKHAQTIFKHWFIDFEFPDGNGNPYKSSGGEMVESELGMIPKGWEVVKLDDFIDFREGPGIRHWQYTEEGVKFLNIRCIKNNDLMLDTANKISKDEANGKYEHFLLKEWDIVMSTSGTLGRYAIVRDEHLPLCLNTSIIGFRPKLNFNDYSYVYGYLTSVEFYNHLISNASGSVQLNFGPTHLRKIYMVMSDIQTREKYHKLLFPVIKMIIANRNQNEKLSQLRDTLLPKLMSGELRIPLD